MPAVGGDLGERHASRHEGGHERMPRVVKRERHTRRFAGGLDDVAVEIALRPQRALALLLLVELFAARAARATRDVEELAARELDDIVLAGQRDGPPRAARMKH